MLQGKMTITFNNNFIFDHEEIMNQIRELLMEQCGGEAQDCELKLKGRFDYIRSEDAPEITISSPSYDDEVMCTIDWNWQAVPVDNHSMDTCPVGNHLTDSLSKEATPNDTETVE